MLLGSLFCSRVAEPQAGGTGQWGRSREAARGVARVCPRARERGQLPALRLRVCGGRGTQGPPATMRSLPCGNRCGRQRPPPTRQHSSWELAVHPGPRRRRALPSASPSTDPNPRLLWTPQPRGENVLSAMEVTKATPSAPRVLGPSQDPTPGAVRTSSGRAGSSVRGLP